MDSWSKGDYSQLIREASIVVERLPVVILPSGRVPGRVLLALPILEARRRRNRDEIAKNGFRLEGFGTCVKYRPRGGVRVDLGGPGAPRRGQGGGRAGRPRGAPVGPLRPYFGRMEASGTLIFYIFFLDFSGQFSKRENLKYKNSRKQKLALGCTELIG